MTRKKPAQILVITLIVMLVVTISVIGITTIAIRNSGQVATNSEYRKNYNLAETRLLELVSALSAPNIHEQIASGAEDFDGECNVISPAPQPSFSCSFDESEPDYRSIVRVSDTNIVENFELGMSEYFTVILDNSVSGLDINWTGETALELTLGYYSKTSSSDVQLQNVIDLNNIYSLPTSPAEAKSGFLPASTIILNNKITVKFADAVNLPDPSLRDLKYLKIKNVSRTTGNNISLQGVSGSTLPNQVRVIEAFSYNSNSPSTAAPVVASKLPLSPQLPEFLDYSGFFASVQHSQCGNGVVEGGEQCDDGNSNDTDFCSNACLDPICSFEEEAQGRNEDYTKTFDVSRLAGQYIHFGLELFWEEDLVTVKVIKKDFSQEILVATDCFGGTDVFADASPSPGTSKFGYEWNGNLTRVETTYGQCTITSFKKDEARTLIEDDWAAIVLEIKNGQTYCSAPNTAWKLNITCPKKSDPIKSTTSDYSWSGMCGSPCGPAGCD